MGLSVRHQFGEWLEREAPVADDYGAVGVVVLAVAVVGVVIGRLGKQGPVGETL